MHKPTRLVSAITGLLLLACFSCRGDVQTITAFGSLESTVDSTPATSTTPTQANKVIGLGAGYTLQNDKQYGLFNIKLPALPSNAVILPGAQLTFSFQNPVAEGSTASPHIYGSPLKVSDGLSFNKISASWTDFGALTLVSNDGSNFAGGATPLDNFVAGYYQNSKYATLAISYMDLGSNFIQGAGSSGVLAEAITFSYYVPDVIVPAVPEPSTWVGTLAFLVALPLFRLRSRQA